MRRPLRPRLVLGAAVVAVAACGAETGTTAPCAPSPFRSPKMLVIAHAGGEGLGPANTVAAMKLSIAAGADVLDIDVRESADGALVAIHDDTVDATTNGTGRVGDLTLAELRSLDAGWEFIDEQGTHPFRGTGVVIPTIEEVLQAFPDTLVSMELKTAGQAPATLCATLRRLARTDDVYVSSNGDAGVDALREICPEVTTTVTDALVVEMRAARTANTAWCSPVPIGQPPFDSRNGGPTRESVDWAHEHGLANFTWTVDDPDTLRYLVNIGMDGVYTRRPDIARAVVDQVTS